MTGGKKIGKKIIYIADDVNSDGPKNIGDFYDLAMKGDGSDGILYFSFGRATDQEVTKIKEDTGVDVSGSYHFISDHRIFHTLKHHGVGNEPRKGHVPVTKEDFEKIPEYIRTADKVSIQGVTGQGKIVLRYQKRVNGHIFILEEHKEKKGILQYDSMWKHET